MKRKAGNFVLRTGDPDIRQYSLKGKAISTARNMIHIEGKAYTIKSLAEDLGVSTDTISRRLKILREQPGAITLEKLKQRTVKQKTDNPT